MQTFDAFGKNTDAAQQHYLQYGIKEGRTDRAIESKATPTPTPTTSFTYS